MNAFTTSNRSVHLALVAAASMACSSPSAVEDTPSDVSVTDAASRPDVSPAPPPRDPCEVPAPAGVTNLVAYSGGVVFGVRDGDANRIERWEGAGCALSLALAYDAAGVLVDVDEAGQPYVMREGDAVVSRVDDGGTVTDVVRAGRGIWGFGVSPAARTMWVTSCGPTGIFAMNDTSTAVMDEPATLWQLEPAVLTADDVFWSVGTRECAPGEAITPACGFALTRSTPTGTRVVGTTIVDFGAGYERARLARCGAGLCGVFPSGIVMWDDAGGTVLTVSRSDLGAVDSESIAQATGDGRGVYALLTGGSATRVVFVPAAHAR